VRSFDPNSPLDRQKLFGTIDQDNGKMSSFRDTRKKFYNQIKGSHYGDEGARKKVPVNLLELAVSIYVRKLAPVTPRCLSVAEQIDLIPVAANMQEAVNTIASEINLGKTLRAVVMDSIMSPFGVVKMGVTDSHEVEMNGILHDANQPYVDAVHLDELVLDTNAKEFEQLDYIGDYYEVPLEYVQENKMFRKRARELARPSQLYTADRRDTRRTAMNSITGSPSEPVKDKCKLIDVFLPYERVICTFLADNSSAPPLSVEDWDGPEPGPYKFLYFNKMPGTVMPLAPAMAWFDLHELANLLFSKLADQADRQKTIGVADGSNDDGDRVVDAQDGEVIRLQGGRGVQEVVLGGVHEGNLAFASSVKDLFAYFSGNIDLLGGLANQTSGFGHDKMLTEQASERLKDMQAQTAEFLGDIFRDLAWYNWHDPVSYIPIKKRIHGTDIDVETAWTPDSKLGDFLQYKFKIEPHGLIPKSPEERLSRLMTLMSQLVMPFGEQLAMQGMEIDLERLFQIASSYADIPELTDIVRPSQGGYDPSRGGDSAGSSQGDKHYVRESVNGNPQQQQQGDQTNPLQQAARSQSGPDQSQMTPA